MLSSRWTLWFVLLVGIIAATVWDRAGQESQDDLFVGKARDRNAEASPLTAAVAPSSPSSAPLLVQAATRPATSGPADLFPVLSWLPVPPKVTKTLAKQAPQLPFSYLGKVMEGNSIVVFLSEGDRTHLVHTGDVVANYRVQEITAKDMTLIYLPLDETQKINFGSAN